MAAGHPSGGFPLFPEYTDDMDRTELGNVLVQLTRIEDEMKRIASEIDENKRVRASYDKRLDEIAHTVKSGVSEIKNRTDEIMALMSRRGGQRTNIVRYYRGPRSPRISLPKLEYTVGPARMRNAYMGAICQVTVLNFLHSAPGVLFWVSNRLWTAFLPLQATVKQATGLSVLFFSPVNNKKSLFKTGPGQIWSYVTRRVIRTVLYDAKTELFGSAVSSAVLRTSTHATDTCEPVSPVHPDADVQKPDWLDVFGDKADIRTAVKEAVDLLEEYRDPRRGGVTQSSASSMGSDPTTPPPAKRARAATRSVQDALHFRVVDETRFLIVQYLNEARTLMRNSLFEQLFFFTEKIAEEGWTPAAAKAHGFWIDFTPISAAESLSMSGPVSEDSPWRTSCVNAEITGEEGAGDINMTRFTRMKEMFPCMNIALHYQRVIDRPRSEGPPYKRDWVEEINLHEVGLTILMECFKNGGKMTTLGLSELTLKTVHVFALALRGLMLSRLGEPVSDVEKEALGPNTGCAASDEISLMVDRESAPNCPTKKYKEVMRNKFHMTEKEYKKWTDDEPMRRQRQNAPAPSPDAPGFVDAIDDDELLQCG